MIVKFSHRHRISKELGSELQNDLFFLEVSGHILLTDGLDRNALSKSVSEGSSEQSSLLLSVLGGLTLWHLSHRKSLSVSTSSVLLPSFKTPTQNVVGLDG